jgi:hypothetical protein
MVHTPRALAREQWRRVSRSWGWNLVLCTACSASHSAPGTVRDGELSRAREGYVPGANGVHLFYRVDGGGGDTVVVLHGGPGLNSEGLRPEVRRSVTVCVTTGGEWVAGKPLTCCPTKCARVDSNHRPTA